MQSTSPGVPAGPPRARRRFAVAATAALLLAGAAVPAAHAQDAADPVPLAPTVTALGPYEECSPNHCLPHGGPGMPGRFRFTPNAADQDVTGYRVRTPEGVHHVTAAEAEAFEVTPSESGLFFLVVEAKDWGSRYGESTTFAFKVDPVSQQSRWRFDDGLDAPAATVAADSGTASERHDAVLHTEGTGWSPLARAGAQDRALLLDTPEGQRPHEYAETARPVVDTSKPFTVSAWAYLTGAGDDRVVLAAPGSHGTALDLRYSAADRRWAFGRSAQDAPGAPSVRSLSADEAVPNAWTHLAGVFHTQHDTDPSNDTVQLYVNGRPQGRPVVLAEQASAYEPWRATGGLQFGRGYEGGDYDHYFRGRIDEVTAWQWSRTPLEIRRMTEVRDRNGEAVFTPAAHWDAGTIEDGRVRQTGPYPGGDLRLSPTGASPNAEEGSLVLDGETGHAATEGPVVDETGSFTVSARVRVDSAAMAANPDGYRALVAGQRAGTEYSWALWLKKYAEDAYRWEFTRTSLGADGQPAETVTFGSSEYAALDTWVELTGVYDTVDTTGAGKLSLYVDGMEQMSWRPTDLMHAQQGTGALTVGGDASGGTTTAHALPGAVQTLRVWTGAITVPYIHQYVMSPVTPTAQ
ncbi:LamG domain-containing protein [Streptomyces sp. NPDC003090]|uniref:LamG domain-containing protein n=1 Tax=Streptomyces sp. NPDC003090 TaxID=3154274 RepID=UPI0038085840